MSFWKNIDMKLVKLVALKSGCILIQLLILLELFLL